ncbi:MAG: phospholipase D-like domain-containing protein [Terriglobales bacterium]
MASRARVVHKKSGIHQVKQGKQQDVLDKEFRRHRALRIIAVICIVAAVGWLLVQFFGPPLKYKLLEPPRDALDSPQFLRNLEGLTNTPISRNNRIEALPNGEKFYAAEIAAMRQARHNIDIDAYIFRRDDLTRRVLDVLTERARHGVRVTLVVDAIGSATTGKNYFNDLLKAGGRMAWYHPVRWNTWMRSNNRTHREITVIDGETAFVGGAGYGGVWMEGDKKQSRWRDTMFRVRGDAVSGLQSAVVQNWLEASGEVLNGSDYFPPAGNPGQTPALVVASTPTTSGATRARLLFQVLMAAARKSIYITTPYFVPDASARDELLRAIRERHVQVNLLVPGSKSDHPTIRSTSRATYGPLLAAGAHIYEYEPTMLHAKILVVDESWVVAGSTNFDPRSFGIDDEDNLAALDPELARGLIADFQQDVTASRHVTYDHWKSRSVFERALEWFGALWQRQQ